MSPDNQIDISYDDEEQVYYAIWKPIIIGMGKTIPDALEDLRQALYLDLDTLEQDCLKPRWQSPAGKG